eukprot:tig00021123_g18495.t1
MQEAGATEAPPAVGLSPKKLKTRRGGRKHKRRSSGGAPAQQPPPKSEWDEDSKQRRRKRKRAAAEDTSGVPAALAGSRRRLPRNLDLQDVRPSAPRNLTQSLIDSRDSGSEDAEEDDVPGDLGFGSMADAIARGSSSEESSDAKSGRRDELRRKLDEQAATISSLREENQRLREEVLALRSGGSGEQAGRASAGTSDAGGSVQADEDDIEARVQGLGHVGRRRRRSSGSGDKRGSDSGQPSGFAGSLVASMQSLREEVNHDDS